MPVWNPVFYTRVHSRHGRFYPHYIVLCFPTQVLQTVPIHLSVDRPCPRRVKIVASSLSDHHVLRFSFPYLWRHIYWVSDHKYNTSNKLYYSNCLLKRRASTLLPFFTPWCLLPFPRYDSSLLWYTRVYLKELSPFAKHNHSVYVYRDFTKGNVTYKLKSSDFV